MTEDLGAEPGSLGTESFQDIKMRNLKAMQQKVAILEESGLARLLARSMNTIIQLRPRNATVGLCRLLAEQCTPEELEEVGVILDEPPMGANSALRPEQDWQEPLDSDSDAKPGDRDDEGSPELPEESEWEERAALAKQALLDLFERMYGPGVFYFSQSSGESQLTYHKEGGSGPGGVDLQKTPQAPASDDADDLFGMTLSLPSNKSKMRLPSAMLDDEIDEQEAQEDDDGGV